MPFGLRFTIGFIRLMAVVALLPILGAALGSAAALIGGAFAANPFPEAVLGSFVLVMIFALLLMMAAAAGWLTDHMEIRHSGLDPSKAVHPGRRVCMPAVGLIAIYGVAAVILWLPSNFKNDFAVTFPWPLAWSIIGSGAFWLYRYLDKTLPR